MVVLLKTASVQVSFIQIMQVRVQNKGKSVWKSRYVGDVSMAGAAADRQWGVFSGRAGRRTIGHERRGAAVWPVVAGGLGGGG